MKAKDLQKRWSTDQLITGIEMGQWYKLLAKNRWKVDAPYLHRAAWITGWSTLTTSLGALEDATWGRKIASQELNPTPLFVLGHWRSGTTHLHNLLGRAPGNTFPTVYQVVFPGCFLMTEQILPRLTAGMMSETRTYDNVKNGWFEAAEDEIALAKLTGLSPYISFMFPDAVAKYEKYIDFLEVPTPDKQRWKDAFTYFLKKIMVETGGKRVVVKSCTHTARIRMLLEMFPNAKFVHIHRHPYEVFASTLHMRSHTDWENFFQVPEQNWDDERKRQTLILGQRLYERVIEDRKLIPPENFVEIAYQDLCGNELQYVEKIWNQFEFGNWPQAEKALQPYVQGLTGYKRNKLKIDQREQDMVHDYWKLVFDTYGYDREYRID